MKVLFLDAPYSGAVELCTETLRYLKKKKYKTVALYASVQFCNQLNTVKQQLEQAGIQWITSQADRAHVTSQLLGCDNYHTSLNLKSTADAYLYVGDGKFHPLALVYGQKDLSKDEVKEIICNDPIEGTFELLDISHIKTILKKYKGSLLKFLNADTVGVLITVKPGQEQMRPSFYLEKKFPSKRFYYFLDNIVSFDQLENFHFIKTWVNTTCPRVGFDDQLKFEKGVINLNDALEAEKILGKESLLTSL